jgi:hypothetical protein
LFRERIVDRERDPGPRQWKRVPVAGKGVGFWEGRLRRTSAFVWRSRSAAEVFSRSYRSHGIPTSKRQGIRTLSQPVKPLDNPGQFIFIGQCWGNSPKMHFNSFGAVASAMDRLTITKSTRFNTQR